MASKTIGVVFAMNDEFSPKLKEACKNLGITENQFKTATKAVQKFSNELGNKVKQASKVAAAGLAVLSGAAIAAVKNAIDTGDKIDKMSQKLQLSRKSFQELDYIASQTGTSIEIFGTANTKLAKAVSGVVSGNKANIQTFRTLGVSVKNSNGQLRSTEDIMFDVLQKLQKMPDNASRAALATSLFGKSAMELQPLLNDTSTTIDEYREKFAKIGGMTDEEIDKAVKLNDTLDDLKRMFGRISITVGTEFMPILESGINLLNENIPIIKDIAVPIFQIFADTISSVGQVLKDNMPAISELIGISADALKEIIPVVGKIAEIIIPLIISGISTVVKLIISVWNIIKAVKYTFDELFGIVQKVIGSVINLIAQIGKITKMSANPINVNVNKNLPKVEGSHASGLDFVPHDNYIASLHRGERVLTATENKNYNTSNSKNVSVNVTVAGNIYGIDNLADEVEKVFARKFRLAMGA